MLTCKEMVKVVSSNHQLTWRQRVDVRLHLLMCHHCRKYVKQLELIKLGFKNLFDSKSKTIPEDHLKELEKKVIDKVVKGK